MGFEIQGLKLNNNKKKKQKNWRNRLFAISPMFVVQFSPNFRYTYILTSAIILWCQKWIITESESANRNFQMYRHDGPRPHPSLYIYKVLPYFVIYTLLSLSPLSLSLTHTSLLSLSLSLSLSHTHTHTQSSLKGYTQNSQLPQKRWSLS